MVLTDFMALIAWDAAGKHAAKPVKQGAKRFRKNRRGKTKVAKA